MDLWSGAARDYLGLSRRLRLSFAAERVAEAPLDEARVRHVDARTEHGFLALELAVASHQSQSLIEILETVDGIWITKPGRLPIPLNCLLAIL